MVHIVSAPLDRGKTSFLLSLVEHDASAFGGVLSLSSPDKSQYFAYDIESGERRLLLSGTEPLAGPSIGRFHCSQEVFDWASSRLVASTRRCMVLDEVGRLELRGEGYCDALKALLPSCDGGSSCGGGEVERELYIAVRDEFVGDVVVGFGIKDYELIELKPSEIHMK